MVTAAEGAEEFYDYGNEARYENVEEARDRDRRLREAYLGHCRYFVVDNEHRNFTQKIKKTTELVSSVLGLPTSPYHFKKYLVDHSSLSEQMPVEMKHSYFNEHFLPSHTTIDDVNMDQLSICVRERKKNGSKIYNYDKRYVLEGERIQELRIISAKDYVEFVRSADNTLAPLHKLRSKFIVDLQPFTLETITNLPGKPTFLRVETANEKVEIPDFIKIIKEVTF